MSQGLYACVHAAEFPSQALLRLRSDLQSLPVAVLEGRAPLEQVCSMNRNARQLGAAGGMTRLEAEALASQSGGLRLLPRSLEGEAAARVLSGPGRGPITSVHLVLVGRRSRHMDRAVRCPAGADIPRQRRITPRDQLAECWLEPACCAPASPRVVCAGAHTNTARKARVHNVRD